MFAYPEFITAIALAAAFLTLGILLVCVPRPRKKGFFSPEEIAQEKRDKATQKSREKARRVSNKAKKKSDKIKKKKKAMREKKK